MADTPETLRDQLLKELNSRRTDIDRLYSYYRGDHPLPWAPREVRDAYLALMKMARTNWCRVIVNTPARRLRVVGLRFSEDNESLSSDVDVWKRLWQGNRLDAESRMVHNAGLIARRGFVLVWPSQDDGKAPTITPEHPSQVIVRYEPGDRRERCAGLKTFIDDQAGYQYTTLWTEDAVYNWRAKRQRITVNTSSQTVNGAGLSWEPWEDAEEGIVPEAINPLGAVPLIEFQSHPEMLGEPIGELDGGVTDMQDRINKTVLDRLVTSNFASFPQKWVTGLEIPQDEHGNDVEPCAMAVNRLFASEDPLTKFGEFNVADLTGYLDGVEADIKHLALMTDTPLYSMLGDAPSGDAVKAGEIPLVAKVLDIRDSYTESWEDAIRLALKADGDPRSEDLAMAMVWRNPESRSDAEVYDAATKQQAVGVPWRTIMEYIGRSPEEIERMDLERAEDAANGLLASSLGSLPANPGGPPARPAGLTPGL
jgi:hypothetical protein